MKFLLDFSDNEMSEEDKDKLISAIKEGKKFYPIDTTFFSEYDEAGFMLSLEEGVSIGTLSCEYSDFVCDMEGNGFEAKTLSEEEMDKMSEEEKKQMEQDAKESCSENPFKEKVKEFN